MPTKRIVIFSWILPIVLCMLIIGGAIYFSWPVIDRYTFDERFLQLLEPALRGFYSDYHRLPTNEEGIHILCFSDGSPNWRGPYLKMEISEEKLHTIRYTNLIEEHKVRLHFQGRDRQFGTEDDSAIDIPMTELE